MSAQGDRRSVLVFFVVEELLEAFFKDRGQLIEQRVVLDLGESDASALEYYNLGRSVGGPKDPRLEARLGVPLSADGKDSAK